MQNQYLEILELQPGASKAEVKSAYRRLSKLYHPDVSKNENAREKFIEINEAYKFLTDVGPRPATIQPQSPAYDYDIQNHAYDEWRRKARAYARKKAEEEDRRQQELTRIFLKVFESVGIILTIINFLIVFDLSWPTVKTEEKILSSSVFDSDYHSMYETLQAGKYEFKFKIRTLNFLLIDQTYNRATVHHTLFFDQPVKIEIEANWKTYVLNQHAGIYGFFNFIPYCIVLIWFLYKFVLRSLDGQLTISVIYIFLIFFEVILFLIGNL